MTIETSADSRIMFTVVRDASNQDLNGVQMMFERGKERWTSRLMSWGEFGELILASRVFPPVKADGLFKRISKQGQITEEVVLSAENIHFLGLMKH